MTKRAEGKFEPSPRGWYPTPEQGVWPLVWFLPLDFRYIEPCAGDGQLVDLLHAVKRGTCVGACDVAPRRDWVRQMDCLAISSKDCSDMGIDMFITNPPWPEPRAMSAPTMDIIKHLSVMRPTWLLLPADFMHNVYAAQVMDFCTDIVSVGRLKWIPDSEHEGFDNCCWYKFNQRTGAVVRTIFHGRRTY